MSVTDWDIRVAMADQIRDCLSTVTDIAISVEPSAFPTPETPSVTIFHGGPSGLLDAVAAFGDLRAGLELVIRVRCSAADIDAGERMLSDFTDDVSALSILAALDSDETLGGLAQTLKWGDWQGLVPIQTDAGDYILEDLLPVAVHKAQS